MCQNLGTEALPVLLREDYRKPFRFRQAGRIDVTRSDAQRNRERIMNVARDALAAPGGASMTQIARLAGTGVGTLYRHFPTREALIMAIYRHDIQVLIDLPAELLREHAPAEALRLWLEEVARYGRLKFGVAEVIHAATGNGLDDPAYEPFVDAIRQLLQAGERAGVIKPALDPEDVLLQLSVLWRIPPAGDASARTRRLLDLITDGFLIRQ
jgi:AcrR family transcriptional regulator